MEMILAAVRPLLSLSLPTETSQTLVVMTNPLVQLNSTILPSQSTFDRPRWLNTFNSISTS